MAHRDRQPEARSAWILVRLIVKSFHFSQFAKSLWFLIATFLHFVWQQFRALLALVFRTTFPPLAYPLGPISVFDATVDPNCGESGESGRGPAADREPCRRRKR
jgi:hypothetical protein